MAPASLDLAWRTTAGTEVSNRVDDRPPGWARLDLGSPPDLGAGIAAPPDARALNADLPVETTPSRPAAPFRFAAAGAERDRALFCLTEAIYYEAALEPEAGQAAVAQVILNRARHPAFPHSICAVVYQGAGGVTGCQ
ncbi:MAG: cell wall hydrolase, partial [Caulobacteraceae bacterium]